MRVGRAGHAENLVFWRRLSGDVPSGPKRVKELLFPYSNLQYNDTDTEWELVWYITIFTCYQDLMFNKCNKLESRNSLRSIVQRLKSLIHCNTYRIRSVYHFIILACTIGRSIRERRSTRNSGRCTCNMDEVDICNSYLDVESRRKEKMETYHHVS